MMIRYVLGCLLLLSGVSLSCGPRFCTDRNCSVWGFEFQFQSNNLTFIQPGDYKCILEVKGCKLQCEFRYSETQTPFCSINKTIKESPQADCSSLGFSHIFVDEGQTVLIIGSSVGKESTLANLYLYYEGKEVVSLQKHKLEVVPHEPNGPGCKPLCYKGSSYIRFSY